MQGNLKVWIRIVPSRSSCSSVGFCSWLEWQMGWIWWAVLVFILFNISQLSLWKDEGYLFVLIMRSSSLGLWFFRYMALLVVSLVCYVATFSFSGLLFYLFAPSGQDCGLNTFFIVMTLIFVCVVAVVTLHPSVSS